MPSRTVLLVGGFGVPAALLRPLARDLGGRIVPTGLTVGCGEAEVQKILGAIDEVDGVVVLVGHSRGGQLARVAAARRPDKIALLVSILTPATIGPPNRWGVPLMASALRRLPSPIAMDCATADCCRAVRADLARTVEAPWTAIWSRADRIVPPDEARHAGAVHVEVPAGHVGAVLLAASRRVIVDVVTQGA